MKARLKSGEIVTLEKECSCINHNEPHWVHMDGIWKKNNWREGPQGRTFLWCMGVAQEESVRLKEKLREMERRGIVELIEEPADEFTEFQQRRYQEHVKSLYPELFKQPEPEPDLNDVRVAAKRRL